MHDPAVTGIHRLKSDDLAVGDGFFAEAARHGGQGVVATAAVAFGVHRNVAAFLAGSILRSVAEELKGAQYLSPFANDSAGIGPAEAGVCASTL